MAWKLLKYLVAILIPATLLAQSHGETWKYDSSTQLSPYKSSVTNVDVPALTVNDNTYDATGWNGSFKVPTENSVRDKIEAMLAGGIDHGSLGGLSDDDHLQYHTDARALTWLGTRSTTDLAEGTNLYWTGARFDTAFGGKTTSNLSEGSNLYFTNERVDDEAATLIQNGTGLTWTYDDVGNTLTGDIDLASFDTGDLAEGSNLYFTNERVDDEAATLIQNGTGISWSYNDPSNTLTPTVTLSPFSTTDLTEGTNLYYTAARFNSAFSGKSTTDLSEGTNLYFTDERAEDAVGGILTDSSSVDFTYNDGADTITAAVLPAGVDHNSLANLTTGDPHTQYTKKATLTAKGSIYAASAASTPAELAVGSNGDVLTADSTQATGVKWSTPTTGVTDHGALTGLSDDDHTQYALLAGRSGGQTITGGTGSGETLRLQSTSHATKGVIYFGSSGSDSAFDVANNRWGIGHTTPLAALDARGAPTSVTWSDGFSRNTSAYFRNDFDESLPTVLSGIFGVDAVFTPSSNTTLNVNGALYNLTLAGTADFGGIADKAFQSQIVSTGSGTISTQMLGGEGRITTTSASSANITNTSNAALSGLLDFNGSGTVSGGASVLAYFLSGNIAGTATAPVGVRVANPSKGAAYTLVDYTALLIEDNTATQTGTKYGVYQKGTNYQNRLVGNTRIGGDTAPTATLDVTGTGAFSGDVTVSDEAYDDTNWNGSLEVPTKNAIRDKIATMSGGGTNALLDGTNHTDTLAGTVARGDVIVGNSTPKWSRLAIGSSGKVLTSNGTDVSWQTPSTPTTMDILTPFGDDGCFTGGSGTSYFMSSISALCNTTESVVQMIIPYAMTVTRLYCYQSTDTSCHATFTARDDGANVTGATCSLTTTGQCDSGAISQAVASGSLIDIKVDETTGDCNSNSNTGCVLVFTH